VKTHWKRVLGTVFVLGLLMALLMTLTGASALYVDTETSEDNTFTAGTLDLTVDGQDDPDVAYITVECMEPNDTVRHYWMLKNTGCVCGQPSIEFTNIVDYENGRNEPEIDAGDVTGGNPGPGNGELGGILYTLMKWRQGTGSWHEILMVPHGHTKIKYLTGPYGLGENTALPLPVLCKNDTVEIELRLWWDGRFSTPADNKAQSDSVEFDVVFHLDQ